MNRQRAKHSARAVAVCTVLLLLLSHSICSATIGASATPPPSGLEVRAASGPSTPREQPDTAPQPLRLDDAPGYCPSVGGSTSYESLTSATLTSNPDGTMKLVVQVYIANPGGCVAGEPCASYDASPEYVNAWLDWNGDNVWDPSERVMDRALTGYLAINYSGTMTAVAQFSRPSTVAGDPTWLRVNLGWAHDPNDPCEYSWAWGNVIDKQVHLQQPKINEITAQGVGTDGNNPETGSPVRLEAALELPVGYEATQCSWTGDLAPGEGDAASNCRYEYTPNTGPGPDVNTYGEKKVTLTLTFRHTDSGSTGQVSKDHTYKVFFDKGGDDDGDRTPNWYEYWGDDGAVPAINDADVYYNPSLNGYGRFTASNGHVEIGPLAAEDEPTYTIPSGTNCPGASLGGDSGIDEAALTIAHEKRHKEIWSNWQTGGIWVGWTDSDEGQPTVDYDDDLPDTYETNTAHTATDNVDSCDLETHVSNVYRFYGDNEFQARLAEIGVTGNATQDWANPGKQSDPPFLASTQADRQAAWPAARSGPAAASATYSTYTYLASELAELTGTYADGVVDTDGDGTYDSLRVSVGIQVAEASTYNVLAWLEDGTGTGIGWATQQLTLGTGTHMASLSFDASLIRGSEVDGPYDVARVELRSFDDELLLDADDSAYATAAYLYSDFDPPDVAFAGNTGDRGVDTDADGLYDLLRVTFDLDVQKGGTYGVVGEVESDSGAIAVATKTVWLAEGAHTLNLDFDGQALFGRREDGTYDVRKLRVTDASGDRTAFVYNVHTTAIYGHDEFQHEGTTLDALSYQDRGLDVDSDGDYDYLRLEFIVNADQERSYQVLTDLADSSGKPITSLEQELHLLPGANAVALDFPGSTLYEYQADGPYQLASITLVDGDGTIVDFQQLAHTTQTYDYNMFSEPLVSLLGSYTDQGRDLDGDGLYDYLDIEVGLIPGDSGVIVAQGLLVDGTGQEIEWVETHRELVEGVAQTITLSFDGRRILAHGEDGPFQLRNLLLYHTGDPGQATFVSEAHTTAAYSHLAFERYGIYIPVVRRGSALPVVPLVNGDFEQGPGVGWQQYSSNGWALILDYNSIPVAPHSGQWAAWLGGDYNETSVISQEVTVPASSPYLRFWYWLGSEDQCGWDFGGVTIDGTWVDVMNLCDANDTYGWVQRTVNLGSYAGQMVELGLRVETDGSLNSNFFVDDVTLGATILSDPPGAETWDAQDAQIAKPLFFPDSGPDAEPVP